MFKREELRYEFSALEPNVDALTMETHYDKHYNGYTNKFNAAIENIEAIKNMKAEDILANLELIPEEKKSAVINNGGGYINHLLYFGNMIPNGTEAEGAFLEAVNKTFGSMEGLIVKLKEKANSLFGSGWTFLVVDKGELKIVNKSNQDSPYSDGVTPIFALDLWEHSYYLNYKNLRPTYVDNFFNIVDWKVVSKRFDLV